MATLTNANLGYANLQNAYLMFADLSEASLFMANMRNSRLYEANLSKTNLENTDLAGAHLPFAIAAAANFRNANLSSAYLNGVFMLETVLTGVNLSKEEELDLKDRAISVIVKGIRSEETLLDRSALHLHRNVDGLQEPKKKMIAKQNRQNALFEDKKILLTDDDMRNVFALSK